MSIMYPSGRRNSQPIDMRWAVACIVSWSVMDTSLPSWVSFWSGIRYNDTTVYQVGKAEMQISIWSYYQLITLWDEPGESQWMKYIHTNLSSQKRSSSCKQQPDSASHTKDPWSPFGKVASVGSRILILPGFIQNWKRLDANFVMYLIGGLNSSM